MTPAMTLQLFCSHFLGILTLPPIPPNKPLLLLTSATSLTTASISVKRATLQVSNISAHCNSLGPTYKQVTSEGQKHLGTAPTIQVTRNDTDRIAQTVKHSSLTTTLAILVGVGKGFCRSRATSARDAFCPTLWSGEVLRYAGGFIKFDPFPSFFGGSDQRNTTNCVSVTLQKKSTTQIDRSEGKTHIKIAT